MHCLLLIIRAAFFVKAQKALSLLKYTPYCSVPMHRDHGVLGGQGRGVGAIPIPYHLSSQTSGGSLFGCLLSSSCLSEVVRVMRFSFLNSTPPAIS